MRNPQNININAIKVSRKGREFFKISEILQFEKYWRIFFEGNEAKVYEKMSRPLKQMHLIINKLIIVLSILGILQMKLALKQMTVKIF